MNNTVSSCPKIMDSSNYEVRIKENVRPLSIFNLGWLGTVVYATSFNNMPCTKRATINWIIVGSIIRARSKNLGRK